jgi:hypothetical protein
MASKYITGEHIRLLQLCEWWIDVKIVLQEREQMYVIKKVRLQDAMMPELINRGCVVKWNIYSGRA